MLLLAMSGWHQFMTILLGGGCFGEGTPSKTNMEPEKKTIWKKNASINPSILEFPCVFWGGVRLPCLSLNFFWQLFGAPQFECSSHPSACILFVAPVVDRQRPAPVGNRTRQVWGNFSRRKFHQEFQVPRGNEPYFGGWGFPYKTITYSLFRWVPPV